ncbi:MAG TPA: hypothetical protein DDY04_05155 [Bacteroidales bacterium]|nr:hypothetical protein [Bacteroidales bacterium]
MYKIAFKSFIILVGLLCLYEYPMAQSLNTYSPYSRYGIGVLSQPGFTQNRSMGGVSQAYKGETVINFNNPASYSDRDSMSFLLDFGFETNTSDYAGYDQYLNPQTSRNTAGGIHHIAISFPVSKRIGIAAGLTPYSFVGYRLLRFETDPDILSTIGRVKYYHTGNGGINNVFVGMGVNPFKNFSVGFNMLYYFGSLDYNNDIEFPLSYDIYTNGYVRSSFQVSDINFNFGIQYSFVLDKENNTSITLGGTYQLGKRMSMTQTWFATLESNLLDTLYPHPDRVSELEFPWSLNAGVAFTYRNKLTIAGEYFTQDWSKTTPFNVNTPMANMESFRFGVEFTPNRDDLKSYFKKVNYRAGFFTNKSNLIVGGKQIDDFGITFGAGLPLKGKTRVNVSLEVGKRGTDENYLIKETFGALNFSFTFYDYPWFFKRKYN